MAARTSCDRVVFVTSARARSLRHVRPIEPLVYPSSEPEDEKLPESTRHSLLCQALCEILRAAVGEENTVGGDQFLYFDGATTRRALAPDGFVKLGVPQHHFESWKTWEEGTPELAFEILSPSDSPERWTFEEKMSRYRSLGVRELMVFHAEGKKGARLRAWDRIDGDLVERVVEDERTPCLTLDMTVLVGRIEKLDGLRLAHDPEGRELVPTNLEARRTAEREMRAAEEAKNAAEKAKNAAEEAKNAAEEAKRIAEARVAELEAALRNRR